MESPNILLFLSDDHASWALGCSGNSEVQTPTLDALAAKGVRFANAFTPSPVCSPARACLLTGLTPSQVGIHDWLSFEDEFDQPEWLAGQKTLYEYMHDAGYRTGHSGKLHLGQSRRPPKSCDYYFGLSGWRGAWYQKRFTQITPPEDAPGSELHRTHCEKYTYTKNGQDVTLEGSKSAFITDHAIEFLDQLEAGSPFFLSIGYEVTHSPYASRHHDPELTSLFAEASFADIPPYYPHPWVFNESLREDPSPEELRSSYVGYYAAATEIDRNVGRVIGYLEQSGRLGHTIIIYTSDHGLALGHHGFFGKGNGTRPLNMYDVSLRVPLIWSGPGVHAGQVIAHCVDHYHTFASILTAAGLRPDPERTYPGSSYVPMLWGEAQQWDSICYGEYGDLRMIRTPEWKLVCRYPGGPNELFHLTLDPGETSNLIDDDSSQPVCSDLRTRLETFYRTYEDPSRSGLEVKRLPKHNEIEAWRDGIRESRGLQIY